jgi:O-acetyl-ADP-ribose deacetylase (regulator of RNase III)
MKEIEGDLIKYSKRGDFDIIAHGCNCKKNWGAGIALQMKKSYYEAFKVDLNSNPVMGEYSICDYYDTIILNIYSQRYPGKAKFKNDSKTDRLKAIENAMIDINEKFKGHHIGLPLIGAGLAGLKWQKVKSIIKNTLTDMNVTIVRYNPNVKISNVSPGIKI